MRLCQWVTPDVTTTLSLPHQVWNQSGRTPYITYEYTVLRDSLPPIPPPPVYTGSDTSAGEASVEMEGLLAPNGSLYGQGRRDDPPQSGSAEIQKGQETNEVYEETAAIDCDHDGATAPKYPGDDFLRYLRFADCRTSVGKMSWSVKIQNHTTSVCTDDGMRCGGRTAASLSSNRVNLM